MHKILLILFLFSFLFSKEPTMHILTEIKSNDIQIFNRNQQTIMCKPYGVITIDELYKDSKLDSTCQESILNFYKKRPDLKYFVESKLYLKQMYHVKVKEESRCIINAAGGKSLSELLLEKGLAVRQPYFKDEEYEYYLQNAQLRAKILKVGVWKENITRECVENIYKK